jgi:integrase
LTGFFGFAIIRTEVKTVTKTNKLTFGQQAEKFLQEGATRKRNPLRPASLRTYKAQIDTHLLPLIGKKPLQDVGNKVVSEVVQKLSEQGLSPNTITLNVTLIKKIRRSAISEDGDLLFPYEWSTEVIDAPATGDAKHPTIDAAGVTSAISKADMTGRALYALLAGTGLRIAEALAIKSCPDDGVSTVFVPTEKKIIVRQQLTRDGLATTKTKAGQREVDISSELNEYLVGCIDHMTPVTLFPGSEALYRDNLKKNGIEGGFHAFRRFRVTHLRMNGVPEALVKYWTGHAAGNITEHYTQVAGEIESRKKHAQQAGLGFELPKSI